VTQVISHKKNNIKEHSIQ